MLSMRSMMPWLSPLAMLFSVAVLTVGMIVSRGAGAPGDPMVAVFPPWWSQSRSFAATSDSGVAVAGFGPVGWLVVAVPGTEADSRRIRESGALLLLNAAAARLCGGADG
jgi:hypothetical protein